MVLSLTCAITWAVGTIFFKLAKPTVHPIVLTGIESLFGVCFFGLLIFFMGDSINFAPKLIVTYSVPLVVSSLFGLVIGGTLFFKTIQLIGASYTAIVECLYLPSVVILSLVFLSESLSLLQALGVLMVVGSVLVLSIKGGSNLKSDIFDMSPEDLRKGIIYGFLSQFTIAISSIMLKPVAGNLAAEVIVIVRLFFGIFIIGAAVLVFRKAVMAETAAILKTIKTPNFWAGCFCCGCLAPYFWIAGLEHVTSVLSAVFLQTSTFFTLFLAALVLKEPLTRLKLATSLAAFLGIVLASL